MALRLKIVLFCLIGCYLFGVAGWAFTSWLWGDRVDQVESLWMGLVGLLYSPAVMRVFWPREVDGV